MKVLIVGGGIGGLALGAFFERCEIEYEIVEKCPDWTHIGYLISLWDSGRDMLKKLGLAERMDQKSTKITKYSLRTGAGRIIKEYNLTGIDTHDGAAVTIVKRSDLHGLLRGEIPSAKLRMNCSIENIHETESHARAFFSDGTSGEYDLIVGADGVHSKVREVCFKDAVEVFRNWRVWYAWIDHAYSAPGVAAEYVEAGEFATVFSAGSQTTAWFFAPADHAVWDTPEGRILRLEEIFKDESALVPGALRSLHDADVAPSDLSNVKLSRWHTDRTVLIGDAAHCLGPYAGIGSTLAMEDAYVLAAELQKVRHAKSIPLALQRYETIRRRRIRRAEWMSERSRYGVLVRSKPVRMLFNMIARLVPEKMMMGEMRSLLAEEI